MKSKTSMMCIYLCSFLIISCFTQSKTYWAHEKKKLEECRSEWIYQNLKNDQRITVLLFVAKSYYDVSAFPNFLIGITEANDTIAFLDKDFEGKIETGDKIKLLPLLWSEEEKSIYKPLFIVYKKSKENDLYCKVKTVYYSKIEKVEAH